MNHKHHIEGEDPKHVKLNKGAENKGQTRESQVWQKCEKFILLATRF